MHKAQIRATDKDNGLLGSFFQERVHQEVDHSKAYKG